MCDPISVGIGVLGGAFAVREQRKAADAARDAARIQAEAQGDAAAERAAAEGEATNRANAKLADDQRRRREQASLISRGSTPTFSLGDSALTPGVSPITSPPRLQSRGLPARMTAALISRGGPSTGFGGGSSGGARPGQQVNLQ